MTSKLSDKDRLWFMHNLDLMADTVEEVRTNLSAGDDDRALGFLEQLVQYGIGTLLDMKDRIARSDTTFTSEDWGG